MIKKMPNDWKKLLDVETPGETDFNSPGEWDYSEQVKWCGSFEETYLVPKIFVHILYTFQCLLLSISLLETEIHSVSSG